MNLKMFQREWHGIDLREIRAGRGRRDELPTSDFYREFYERLAREKATIDGNWAAAKREMGAMSRKAFLEPWEAKHGRKPSILALGAGFGYIEMDWLERGYDVTLQECQSASIDGVLERFPGTKVLIGDAQTMAIEGKYDIVTLFGLDCTLRPDECVDLLKTSKRCLSPEGVILLYSVNTLSLRQLAAEVVKTIIGHHQRNGYIFWGVWRSVGEYVAMGREAGTPVQTCYLMDGPDREAPFREFRLGWPGLHLRGPNSAYVMK